MRSFALESQTSNDVAARLWQTWQQGLSGADHDALPTLVAGLSLGEVQSALDACLARAVLSAVGDKASIDAQLKSNGLPQRRGISSIGREVRVAAQ